MSGAPAGNIEYGFCKAQHSEEFAGAAYLSTAAAAKLVEGDTVSIEVLSPVFGLASRGVRCMPTPCGNCRDYLHDVFGLDLETVYGQPDGGVALVIPLSTYLVGEYPRCGAIGPNGVAVANTSIATLRKGAMLANDPFSSDGVHDMRKYAAMIVAKHGQFFGARWVPSDFHSMYPLEDSVRAAERADGTVLREAFVACEGDGSRPPDVMYRDRQRLYDFNLQAELVRGCEQDPPVYLATIQGAGVTGLWQTSVKQWLPRPFSARNFADMARLEAYYKKRFPQ